jgi:hypothetical protein
MMRAGAGIGLLFFACGCGSVPTHFVDAGDATVPDAPSFSDAAPYDSAYSDDAPEIALDGGGPFLCFGCVCDGTNHYCYDVWTGAPLDVDGGPDAEACPSEAGASACLPVPVDCLPNPTCSCLAAHGGCADFHCALDPTGNGLEALCILP